MNFIRNIQHVFIVRSGTQKLHVELVAVNATSLDPRYVFFLDIGPKIYIWNGKKCNSMTRAKTRYENHLNSYYRKYSFDCYL